MLTDTAQAYIPVSKMASATNTTFLRLFFLLFSLMSASKQQATDQLTTVDSVTDPTVATNPPEPPAVVTSQAPTAVPTDATELPQNTGKLTDTVYTMCDT